MVEVLVGILIGLIVVAVIYNTLVVAEGFRRATLGVADAQVTGQLSQFVIGRELANAGNGVMSGDGVDVLSACSLATLRPMPVLIEDSVAADTPAGASVANDRITLFYSNSPRIVHPVRVDSPVQPANNDPIVVVSPNGFAVNDWFIAVDSASTDCTMGQVTAITQPDGVTAWPPAAAGGLVKLAFTKKAGTNHIYPTLSARVVNLGRSVTRTTYSIDPTKWQLNSTDENPGLAAAATAVPLAQNVVLLKAQYGVDTNNDQVPDCWTPADAADTCGVGLDFSKAFFTGGAPPNLAARIRAIKAVRVAIVVRSEDVAKADAMNATLVNQSAWIFNCAANDATCQGRIQLDNTILQDYGRYRIYEATIPLRNAIWNQL
ncbi:MAG: PilW family protein [Burkholderiales bacterium]